MVELQRLFEEVKRESEALAWEGTFEEYLNMVIDNPALARHSHARIYDMIMWTGTKRGLHGVPIYLLFADAMFGLDKPLDRLVQFFHAAAQGLEVRKRIFLLLGPPASGKSSIVDILKRGLERYSRYDDGAMYVIKGCPLQEEPLHLVPPGWREELARDHNIHIEGDLCPRCLHNLRGEYGDDISRVRVRRVGFSQSQGLGMGSFVATDPQSQDISRLVGTVDASLLTDDRLEGAGRAFRLDGELEAANRGIMEFIEIFKSEERFLTIMLGVTQEQLIKLGSFGSVYADEAIIAHSNEEEYNAFINNKQTEALRDRIIMVRVPYNLQVSEEVEIYQKLVAESHGDGTHLAPSTLYLAAVVAILSRLEPAQGVGGLPKLPPLEKMRLYDGLVRPPYTHSDVERLQEASPREGMFGLSPRYVINRIADAMTRHTDCLTPLAALQSLLEGVEERAVVETSERERFANIGQEALKEYKNLAVREVQRASVEGFDDLAKGLFDSYTKDAQRFCASLEEEQSRAQASPPLGQHLLRRVEGAIYLRESDRVGFRQKVCQTYHILQEQGQTPHFYSLPLLSTAIEGLLFPRLSDLKPILSQKKLRPDRQQRRDAIQKELISNYGYCELCTEDLLDFAGKVIHGKEVVTVRNGKLTWR